jgi:hypothetical protein
LKLFIDNNFDEKSEVLEDTNPRFANMDVTFDIREANAKLDIFKMESDFIHSYDNIEKTLPGDQGENIFIKK